jgi:Na+/H+ antiporter NhaD/arsenite permease-like protein
METIIIAIFLIGYGAIVLEHPIKINKTASAILTAILCWVVYVLNSPDVNIVEQGLERHLAETAQIIFFLMAAMTIVELVDAHEGFRLITDRIKTTNAITLLWVISIITFFLSPILDNLTASIVMVSLLRKLVDDPEKRKFYAGMVIIAANSGGAWSPMGDVTTTMLWIKGFVSAGSIVSTLFTPSLVSLIVPLVYLSFTMKGEVKRPEVIQEEGHVENVTGSRTMFFTGIGALLSVPIFKTVTHLPPYMGMMLGLSVVWIVSEIIHSDKDEEERKEFSAAKALSRIDSSSMLFFFGILIAIGALGEIGILRDLATFLDDTFGNIDVVVIVIGMLSSVVDNVPLVAGAMEMYDLAATGDYAMNGKFWEFLAYCAGTGGSLLVIGSAAGVAVMGMERIDFIWYLRRISWLALIGYLVGAAVYLAEYYFLGA